MKPLEVVYEIDSLRNNIAKSWPIALDDKLAQKDWNWKPKVNKTKELIKTMLLDLGKNQ